MSAVEAIILIRMDNIPKLVRNVVECAVMALLRATGESGLNVQLVDNIPLNVPHRRDAGTAEGEKAYARERMRETRANMTPQEKERPLQKRREQNAKMTPEKKAARAKYDPERRLKMTEEQKQARLAGKRESWKNRDEAKKEEDRARLRKNYENSEKRDKKNKK
ncbi:hypothetical protein A4X09_0g3727 [Tilletia walkeri]|uniref:Uncharacterized protein n=1 Tax=Tilletia walkeri TaxID=117179 RepID=A0A8X7NAV3_9BASI|nr:hypothetical protein A4X09_0g3727 [Tilletia walkeri]